MKWAIHLIMYVALNFVKLMGSLAQLEPRLWLSNYLQIVVSRNGFPTIFA